MRIGQGVTLVVLTGALVGLQSAFQAFAGPRTVEDPQLSFSLAESFPAETNLDLPDIANAVDVWLEDFSSAAVDRELLLAHFYLAQKSGEALDPILAALKDTAKAGKDVRILFEKKLSPQFLADLPDLQSAGIETKLFDVAALTGGIHHAKYYVKDGSVSFIGSQNLDWRSLSHIGEVGVRVQSKPFASQIKAVFEGDWKDGSAKRPKQADAPRFSNKKAGVEYLYVAVSPPALTPKGYPNGWDEMLRLLGSAKKSVHLQALQYAPAGYNGAVNEQMHKALIAAAGRGVRVNLLVSNWNLKEGKLPYLRELSTTKGITVKISSIPEHSKGFIPFARVEHSKIMIVDDAIGWVGTSNYEPDYFSASRNLEVIFKDRANVPLLAKKFAHSWDSLYAATFDPEKSYTPPRTKE